MGEALFHLCEGLSRSAGALRADLEAWAAAPGAVEARDLEPWLLACLPVRAGLGPLAGALRQRARANQLGDLERAGQAMLGAFDAVIHLFEQLAACVKSAEAGPGAAELAKALEEVKEGRAEFRRRWPFLDPEAWRRTREDLEAGRYQSAREVVHELRSPRAAVDQGRDR
jgi:hypothetical protein